MRKLIDLTHEFNDAMPVYPGDPAVHLTPTASISKDGYSDHKIISTMHIGTHIDAPSHMLDEGAKLTDFPLSRFQGIGVIVDAREQSEIGCDLLDGLTITLGSVVLIWTDWSEKYRTENYYKDWPVLTKQFADALTKKGVSMVGMDTPSPDKIDETIIHKTFFKKDILILENLTAIADLKGYKNFRVHAYPVKYTAGAAPVRVIAEVG